MTKESVSARSAALEALASAGSNPILRSFPHGAIIAFDEDLRFLCAGGLGLADVGLSQELLEGNTIFDVFPPHVAAAIEPLYRRALAGQASTLDVPYEGRIFLQKLGPLRDAEGHIIGGMGFTQDITESRAHELALSEERRRLRQAQAVGHVGSWEWDRRTDSVTWSDTLFEIYGLHKDDFAGDYEAARLCIHPDDAHMMDDATDKCLASGVPMHFRHRIIRADDHELRWVDARGEAICEDGQIVRLAGALADITDHVEAEARAEEIRDAAVEASRQKSVFLATMSHEIRTPMNAVIGMTGLLLDTPLDPEQREFVETVRTSGDSLLTIINDILDFSKIEAGGLQLEEQRFDLHACVDDALDVVTATPEARGLEVVGDVDVRCPDEVVGDVTRLRQVLVNLLSNAVKFTDSGHVRLTVSLEAVAPDAAVESEEVILRIAVADTGIGIPADRLGSLFESFSQVDASTTRLYGGTGLGLTITQRLVEAMGGTMTVQSVVGVGSTFSFSVRLGRAARFDQIASSGVVAARRPHCVLIVDGDAVQRHELRRQLEGFAMRVLEAPDGETATHLLSTKTPIDVAIVDMRAPGPGKQDAASVIRGFPSTKRIPVVLLRDREDRVEQPHLFSAVLTKPVRNALLLKRVTEAILPQPSVLSSPSTAATVTRPESMRVLLAEDNAVNQRMGRLMLERLGHLVDVVGNGQEAADAVGSVPYDVVFMDIEMPQMDGLDGARTIRRHRARRQPQIVALTAGALSGQRQACLDAGMDDYLTKPLRLTDLDTALNRAAARILAGDPATVNQRG